MNNEPKRPAPDAREVDHEEGGHDTSWQPPPPQRKRRAGLGAALVAGVSLGLAGLCAWYALGLRKDLAIARADLLAAEHDVGVARTRTDQQATRAESLAKESAEHAAGKAETEKQLAAVQADASASHAELDALRAQRAEMEKRLTAWKSITEKLRKMIDAGRLQVMVRDGRMILKLSNEVLFDTGKADLAPDGKAALREVAAILRQFPDRRFMIGGHTDDIPLHNKDYRNNWELSTARAVSVTEFLVASGVRPNRLVAAGYGEYEPVASNRTDAGRRENRRIEIVLLPNVGELPPLPDDAGNTPPAHAAAPAQAASAPVAAKAAPAAPVAAKSTKH